MQTNEAANQVTQAGWWETLKEKMQLQALFERLKDSKSILIDVVLYGGIGFLSGFFLKKYATYVAFFVLMIVGFIILQQLEVISIVINWSKVQELFGIQPGAAGIGDGVGTIIWEWMKANPVITISYIIGFLIGLRLG